MKKNKNLNTISAIIFYGIAEYCYHSAVFILKYREKEVQTELWNSEGNKVVVVTKKYLIKERAYVEYELAIGRAILGGLKVFDFFFG